MTPDQYPIYDFLAVSKVERPLAAALNVWLNKFAKLFVERWLDFAPTKIAVSPLTIDSICFDKLQTKWTRPALGVPINIKQGAVQGMIVATRSDILLLLMEILSETLSEKPADRELTSIEISLFQLVLDQSLATFGEAWPEKEILQIEMGVIDEQPNRSRLFAPQREMLVTGFNLLTSSGQAAGAARVEWVFARDEMKNLLGVAATAPVVANKGTKITVDHLSQITVDVSASLGTAELNMHDLLQLNNGDIIKLNQPIEQPLLLQVNEHPTFAAWPGRSGEKQSFQIESIVC